jgi:uncharacterized membrane protein
MSQAPPPAPPPPPPSSPGPPGGPAPGGAAPFKVGDAISYGWNAYWKNVGPLLIITIVIVAIHLVFQLIGFATRNAFLSFLLGLIAWIVGLILAMGLIRCSLAVVRGETPQVDMLFQTEGLGSYIIASILFGIMLFVGLILCIIPGIIVAIVFMFYGFLIVENPSLGPTDALKRASELTKGRIGELFVFGLALFGINLIGALLCGIGLLFTYGITAVAVAYAYRTLNGESVAPVPS